jgi:hypothetical protein
VQSSLKLVLPTVLVAAALAPGASASPSADLASVVQDYSRDQKITPCRFTQGQLESARRQISEDIEIYAKGVRAAIVRETRRWKTGGCARKAATLRIVRIQPKGEAASESVTIKNVGRRAVNLRGYALRDSTDHTLKLRSTKLKAGRTLRVVTGCRKGSSSAVRRGSRYYACRTKQVWDDAGDVVELLGPGGGLLSRKRY